MFEAVGARARPDVWWHGAAADRLLDERHAALVERGRESSSSGGAGRRPSRSPSRGYGERGSIDVLGGLREVGAVAVVEVKSDFGSLEETNRRLDMKERLAP